MIILGGIGFPILVNFKDIVLYHLRRFWKLIRTRKLDRHKMQHLYNLNTKIVLIMTFLLLLIGTLAIAAFEWNGSLSVCLWQTSGRTLSSMPFVRERQDSTVST